MIKDSKGSQDGWYWAEVWDAQCVDDNKPPFAVPYAGFGLYSVRCYSSAEKEHTFTYSNNIKGFQGDPDSYFVDLSWASVPLSPHASSKPAPSPNPNQFLTSDQCMGCHSAGTYGNVMIYSGTEQIAGATPVMNVSPFGEWRWSPMGLAGRDPIFYAQLDSEIAFVRNFFKSDPVKVSQQVRLINNTCFQMSWRHGHVVWMTITVDRIKVISNESWSTQAPDAPATQRLYYLTSIYRRRELQSKIGNCESPRRVRWLPFVNKNCAY